VTRDQVFAALSRSMVTALAIWNRGAGFDAIRAGWLARAHHLGRPLTIKADGRHVEGIFVGLDPQGRLLLDTPDGREMITVGDVMPSLTGMVH
jgi:BirA family biotin operon repressor/biotin-[acetyl-CoA-carboxylase] ligase